MTAELQDQPLKGKSDRGRYTALALVTLYLVLAVVVGVVRSQLQKPHLASAQTLVSQASPDAVKPQQLNQAARR